MATVDSGQRSTFLFKYDAKDAFGDHTKPAFALITGDATKPALEICGAGAVATGAGGWRGTIGIL